MQGERKQAAVQIRIILVASVVLLAVGMLLFFICEWNASMAGMSLSERFFNSLFQSATLRSAGFNSVDTSLFSNATIWFSICFMIIGGAPGSTAGGIKITTLVVLLLAVRGIAAGRPTAVVFKREIPQEVVYRSAGIVILYLLLIFILLFLLLLTQPLPFEILAFEAASALGTVGISMGATPDLNSFGKTLVIVVIFIGRVGPLALALLLGRRRASRLRYPEEQIMVG
jgi:trk system potassium uptake protein TrkH